MGVDPPFSGPRPAAPYNPAMSHAETVRSLVGHIHAAGGANFVEEPAGSGVLHWKVRLGRWPFEMQVDRFALEVRCYLADELFCTGRIPEDEIDLLMGTAKGPGDAAALAELAAFVDGAVRADSRRFLQPPHADRHPDRRADPLQKSAIEARPPRSIDTPG